jgi:hypothetical protein
MQTATGYSAPSDRILTRDMIENTLADDDYGTLPEAIVFLYHQYGRQVLPYELMELPFIQSEMSRDPRIGMVYGVGSGCALVRKTVVAAVQRLHRTGRRRVESCEDFMNAIKELGFKVQQDNRLHAEFLP